jgi:hypothetical protein
MMTDYQWPVKPDLPFTGKWSSWFAALRSGYDINVSWWHTFMEQSEDMFFKAFKESPLYSGSLEDQLRELWDTAKKSSKTQQDTVREQLQKMESLLKEKEEAR